MRTGKKTQEKQEIGARLHLARLELGFTQDQFAEVLGASLRTIQGYERGERSIPGEAFVRLHQKLRLDPSWILLGQNPDKIEKFKESIDRYAEANGISLDAAKRTAIIDRWAKSLEAGREINMADVHFWIRLATGD